MLTHVEGSPVEKVKIFDLQGRTVFSTELAQIGDVAMSSAFKNATLGQVTSQLGHRDTFTALNSHIENRHLLASYIPIYNYQADGEIVGVFEVYTDVTPWLEQIGSIQRQILTRVSLTLIVLYGVLFLFVSRSDALLQKQQEKLLESEASSRRQSSYLEDTLTELRQVQTQLQLALESSNTGLWDWNLQTNEVSFAEKQWKEFLGYDLTEPLENNLTEWENRIHTEDKAQLYADITKHLQGETETYENIHRIRCKDGTYKWNSVQGKVVERDQDGKPARFIGTHTDISDIKRSEIVLTELSEKLKKSQEVAHLGHWSFDLVTEKITWSEEIFRIFGMTPDQGEPSLSQHIQQFHPEDRTFFLERFTAAREGKPQDFDCRILLDDEIRYINSRIELEFQDEKLVKMFGVIMDITVRRIAEIELERFFTISLDLLCIADSGGHFRRLNKAWESILGYSISDLEGKVFLDFVHPDDLDLTLAAISDLKDGHTIMKFVNRYRTKDGNYRYIEWLSIPQEDLIYASARDMTEQMNTQTQLKAILDRTQVLNQLSTEIRNSLALDSILESSVCAIFEQLNLDICAFAWYNPDAKTAQWEVVQETRNPQLCSWLGSYELEEFPLLFQNIFEEKIYTLDIQNSQDNQDPELRSFCESMKINLYLALPIHTEGKIGAFEMGRIDGSLAWKPDEIDLLQNLATQVAIAIKQADLYQTSQAKSKELERAYEELQQTQIQLIQSEKMSSLGQLVAGIAHEINNPVSFIYGNLEPLEEYAKNLLHIIELYQTSYPTPSIEIMEAVEEVDLEFIIKDLPKTLQSMKTGASRIQNIVKSLRTFSRLDEADLKPVDLHENIDSTLMILQSHVNGRMGKPEIAVIKNYGNLPKLECYIGLLNQVFMNLLMNGIQAIEERQIIGVHPTYQGMITITTMVEPSKAILISVQDNGIGMSKEVKDNIFNPFFTTKPVGRGTGMGLSNSYQIVRNNHQGELLCDSAWGQGTNFTIRLPLRQDVSKVLKRSSIDDHNDK
ncbi:PAS domain-containing protein [Nodularia harveyana UHCC-0300]|uniref:histidine kinase n=1 Tax=Nodularia harveyana UHCC-0300 TaxID=2974287 RepID=A0ABU5UD10_9CYAN|nr:PAS domain-containing protein [Nodularia harveyana]MEA5581417.1 PAS domain-containing protein [Nodularia harveyana UHCC-0300]